MLLCQSIHYTVLSDPNNERGRFFSPINVTLHSILDLGGNILGVRPFLPFRLRAVGYRIPWVFHLSSQSLKRFTVLLDFDPLPLDPHGRYPPPPSVILHVYTRMPSSLPKHIAAVPLQAHSRLLSPPGPLSMVSLVRAALR